MYHLEVIGLFCNWGWAARRAGEDPYAGSVVVARSVGVPESWRASEWRWTALDMLDRRESEKRANDLLISLLDTDQRTQLNETGSFAARTEIGTFIFDLTGAVSLVPVDDPCTEIRLCVAPANARGIPPSDICISLLLSVVSDPAAFLETANVIESETHEIAPEDDVRAVLGLADS